MLQDHGDQKPFGAEGDEGGGQEAEQEEGRVAIGGQEIVHGPTLAELTEGVKAFVEGACRVHIHSKEPLNRLLPAVAQDAKDTKEAPHV